STERLLIPQDADLVARRHLPRDPRARVLEQAVRVRSPAHVGCIQPPGRVSGVEVVVHVRAVRGASAAVRGHEIPQTIPCDRSANRPGYVVYLSQRTWRGDPQTLEIWRQVVGLELLAGPAEKDRTMCRVAAALRHEVDDEAARFGFAQSTRAGERHFLSGAGVYHIAGCRVADRWPTDGEAVERQSSLVGPAAVNGICRG